MKRKKTKEKVIDIYHSKIYPDILVEEYSDRFELFKTVEDEVVHVGTEYKKEKRKGKSRKKKSNVPEEEDFFVGLESIKTTEAKVENVETDSKTDNDNCSNEESDETKDTLESNKPLPENLTDNDNESKEDSDANTDGKEEKPDIYYSQILPNILVHEYSDRFDMFEVDGDQTKYVETKYKTAINNLNKEEPNASKDTFESSKPLSERLTNKTKKESDIARKAARELLIDEFSDKKEGKTLPKKENKPDIYYSKIQPNILVHEYPDRFELFQIVGDQTKHIGTEMK